MSSVRLHAALAHLENLLSPAVGYTNETKIWQPERDDPHADFKSALINRAFSALESGRAVFAGAQVPLLAGVSESDFDAIQSLPAEDAEKRDYFELANAIQVVSAAAAATQAST